ECLPEGFKQMVPAILILTFAWSLKAMTDSLGAKEYVAGVVKNSATGVISLLPVIIFIIALGLAFATGTSWATFGILIPIVVAVFEGTNHTMMIMSMSACMAGAVCGDHCSPISDTTIMSSAGAQCVHMNHVSTQIPYAMTAAAVTALTYLLSGILAAKNITTNPVILLAIGGIVMIGVILTIRGFTGKEE
ncbi:MAG: Na+/H+ antiporter NhaC family protein, partial [Lachnospiraceae bacterium]|nr:Na+/H+ antiporter NhaC family protein [Lachnospiraceae bacterium]